MSARPEPLLTRAHVTAAVSAAVSLLVTLGVFPATLGKSLTSTADAIVSVAFLVASVVPVYVHAFAARRKVTPVSDPRGIDGSRLVPEHSAAAQPSVIDALAAAAAVFPAVVPAAPPRDPYASPAAV